MTEATMIPSASPPARKPHIKRGPTSAQIAALAVVTALVVAGALASDAAPTGHGVVDAFERCAFAALMVLAGSRARRWALVSAPALAAAAALGWSMFIGLGALAVAVFLVGRDRRDRVYGGVIGGMTAITLLHLQIGWFLGAPTLVAVISSAFLLASGYRNSSRASRRIIRRAVLVVAVFGAVSAVLAGYESFAARETLLDGVERTKAGVADAQQGQGLAAAQQFGLAAARFSEVNDSLSSWWLSPARMLPIAAQNLAVVRDVAGSGADLTASAAATSAKVDYERLRAPAGGIDLSVLAGFKTPIDEAARTLRQADGVVHSLRSPWIVGPLVSRLDDFAVRVRDLRHEADIASVAIDRAPAVLGSDGVRRYLVLVGNPAEARDLGGHLGNWAEIELDQGRIHLVDVGTPKDLTAPLAGAPDLSSFPTSLVESNPVQFPQNWGNSPDLPTDARLAAELFRARTGTSIDGVLYTDPYAFAQFLAITGPVPIPGLNRQLSSNDAVPFLVHDQFGAFADDNQANDSLTAVIRTVFDRLSSLQLPGPRRLSQMFAPLTHQGRFQFTSLHLEDRPLMVQLGLDGAVELPQPSGELVGVLNRNANPSKIDYYLHRSVDIDTTWDPSTGEINEVVTVTLRNDAPADGQSPTVIGNAAGLPSGTNLTDVVVLSTLPLESAEIDGVAADSREVWDGDVDRQTVRVALGPGETHTVTVRHAGEIDTGDVYRVALVGQPLVNRGTTSMHVATTDGDIVAGRGIRVSGAKATATFSDDSDAFARFEVDR